MQDNTPKHKIQKLKMKMVLNFTFMSLPPNILRVTDVDMA